MVGSKYRRNAAWQWTGTIVVAVVAFLALPPMASGQTVAQDAAAAVRLKLPDLAALAPTTREHSAGLKWSVDSVLADRATIDREQPTVPRRERSIGRKILGGAIGAVGGFFAGGFLGAKIEGDRCNCDDPGLQGALIGAPVGAVVGGILGVKFF